MKNISYFLVGFLLLAVGCTEERDCKATPDISGIDKAQLESDIREIEAYLEANNISYQTDASGIRYATLEEGTGDRPDNCNAVVVNYEGSVLGNRKIFDSGIDFTVRISREEVIRGWLFGLFNMRKNGDYKLYIPSGLGYGEDTVKNSADSVIIPPNSNLEFRIRLTNVVPN